MWPHTTPEDYDFDKFESTLVFWGLLSHKFQLFFANVFKGFSKIFFENTYIFLYNYITPLGPKSTARNHDQSD